MNIQLSTTALAFVLLAGCGSPDAGSETRENNTNSAAAPSPAMVAPSSTPTLSLTGVGPLVVGQQVPSEGDFTADAAAPGSTCRLFTSTNMPGVTALAEDGTIRRVTVAGDSNIKLEERIGVGSTRQEVMRAFPGFAAEPHKYEDSPSGYMTQPGDDPRLRFEIGQDDRVQAIHVGRMPQLAYVEGCA